MKSKVICYSEKWDNGGIEAFIMNLCRNIDKNKIQFTILSSQEKTKMYDREIDKNNSKREVTMEKVYKSPIIRTIKNFYAFNKKIKKMECDVIHLNIYNGVSMIYAYFSYKAGIKKIIIHSHNANTSNINRKIKILGHSIGKKMFEKYGTDYWACSDNAAKWLFTDKTLKQGKVKIIPNGIDTRKFKFNQSKRSKIRSELNITDKIVIGTIGRLSEQKNQEYLLEIFEIVHKRNKNTILLLVGEGELKEKLQKKVKKMNLENYVIFYGTTCEPENVLSAMDVFLLPSLFEGNPVVGIEAQNSGLKCIVSDTITINLNITGNVEFLSIKEKPEVWADKIINQKKYERKDMSENIKNKGYDIKDVSKKIEGYYIN